MNLQKILGIYVDKFGEDYDISTATLSEEGEMVLISMLTKAISINKPISKKKLIEFFGYDKNDPGIII
jgi:hypothetical protein